MFLTEQIILISVPYFTLLTKNNWVSIDPMNPVAPVIKIVFPESLDKKI